MSSTPSLNKSSHSKMFRATNDINYWQCIQSVKRLLTSATKLPRRYAGKVQGVLGSVAVTDFNIGRSQNLCSTAKSTYPSQSLDWT